MDAWDLRLPKATLEDPRDKWCLTVCFVCKEVAKPGQEHLRNYGGIVCYSCRAFWRRSHQGTRRPNFVCKKNGNCFITVATRRRCQKCRYERCLVAGMNPDAVLNEDQKKIRFRKLLMKRQKQLAKEMKVKQASSSNTREVDVKNVVDSDDTESEKSADGFTNNAQVYNSLALPRGHMPPMFAGQADFFHPYPVELQHFQTEMHFHYQLFNQGPHEMDHLYRFQEPANKPEVNVKPSHLLDLTMRQESGFEAFRPEASSGKSTFGEIVDAYIKAMESQRCLKIDVLLATISGLHSSGECQSNISKNDLKFLTLKLSQTFVRFATSLREFNHLDVVNQEKLLVQNTTLFVQLFLGQNFLVESGHIPKDTKFEDQPKKKVWMSSFAQKLFLDRFNSKTGLFVNGTDLDTYGRLILKLKGLHEASSYEQKAILAYILLFYPHNSNNFKYLEEMFDNSIETCDDNLTLSALIATLTRMANFCTDNIVWNEIDFCHTKQVRNHLAKDELFATC